MQFWMILGLKWLSAVASLLLRQWKMLPGRNIFSSQPLAAQAPQWFPVTCPDEEQRKEKCWCHLFKAWPQRCTREWPERPCSSGNQGAHGTVWAELLAVERALGGAAWSKSFHTHFLSFNRWSTPRGINEYIWKIKFMLEKKRTKTFFSIFDLYKALHVTIYNYAWSISLLENYFLLKTNCFYIENF